MGIHDEKLYTIEAIGVFGSEGFRLTIHETGEIREAWTIQALFKSLVRDHGFYLRKVR